MNCPFTHTSCDKDCVIFLREAHGDGFSEECGFNILIREIILSRDLFIESLRRTNASNSKTRKRKATLEDSGKINGESKGNVNVKRKSRGKRKSD